MLQRSNEVPYNYSPIVFAKFQVISIMVMRKFVFPAFRAMLLISSELRISCGDSMVSSELNISCRDSMVEHLIIDYYLIA